MTVKDGMLPGDEFSFEEWKAAQGKPRNLPADLPNTVKIAYEEMAEACRHHGIPMACIFGLQDVDNMRYDLLDKPENVSHNMLLARSAVAPDYTHKMVLMAHSLQNLDLKNLKFP